MESLKDFKDQKSGLAIVTSLAIIILVAGILLAITVVGGFAFSGTLRWTIIGILLIIGGVWLTGQLLQSNREITGKKLIPIFIIITIGVFFIFGGDVLQTAFGGMEVFSIDKVDVMGEGEKILITASVGKGAERLKIDFDEDEINDNMDDEFSVDRGINGEARLTSWKHIFPIRKQDKHFHNLADFNSGNKPTTYGSWDGIDECKERGYDKTVWYYVKEDSAWYGVPDLICVEADSFGEYSKFTGEGETDFEIDFNVDGEEETISRDDQKVYLHNGDVQAQFEGSFEALDELTDINYDVIFEESQYSLIEEGAWERDRDRQNNIGDWLDNCYGGDKQTSEGDDRANDCVKDYTEDNVYPAISSKEDEFLSNRLVESIEFSESGSYDGEMRVQMAEPTGIPVLKIWVDADWVGLERLMGEPEITNCVDDVEMKSGDYITEKVTVKNVGEQDEYFDFSGNCDNGVRVTGSGTYVESGETKDVELRISGSNTESGTKTSKCDIEFEGENSRETDECSFNVDVEYSDITCTPGEIRCEGGNLEKCNDDADDWEIHERCSDGCGYDSENNEYRCNEDMDDDPDDPDDPDDSDELSCKWYEEEKYQNEVDRTWYNYIGIGEPEVISKPVCATAGWVYGAIAGIVVIVLGVTTIIVYKKPNKSKSKKRRKK